MMKEVNGNGNGRWIRVWQILTATVAVTAIPWCIWVTSRLHAMDLAVTKLESFADAGSRFTSEHGRSLKLELDAKVTTDINMLWRELASTKSEWLKELSNLNTQIALLPQTIQIPPKWWEDYVRHEFTKVDNRVTALERDRPGSNERP